jgi:hypothetical protein
LENFDVLKRKLVKNGKVRYDIMGKQRQHFQENFFFALFNIQNCLWKPLHPQSFDASYAPGGGSITKVRQAFLHMGMACISLRTYFSAPESE